MNKKLNQIIKQILIHINNSSIMSSQSSLIPTIPDEIPSFASDLNDTPNLEDDTDFIPFDNTSSIYPINMLPEGRYYDVLPEYERTINSRERWFHHHTNRLGGVQAAQQLNNSLNIRIMLQALEEFEEIDRVVSENVRVRLANLPEHVNPEPLNESFMSQITGGDRFYARAYYNNINLQLNICSETTDEEECTVCFENVNCNNYVNLNCNHRFCGSCTNNFINSTNKKPKCPLCRETITHLNVKKQEIHDLMKRHSVNFNSLIN